MRYALGILILIVVWGAASGCAESASPRPTVPRVLYGFNDNAVAEGIATPQQVAGILRRAGAAVDRVQVDWRAVEPRPGQFDLGLYDRIYHADVQAGVRPLFILAYAPQWAAQLPCLTIWSLCAPAAGHFVDAAALAAKLAVRYPRLAALEIWNEPNTSYFWNPNPDPAAYTQLLSLCYRAAKHVAPRLPVLGGSLANSPGGSTAMALPVFLRSMLSLGAGRVMDGLSVHPYPAPGDVSGNTGIAALGEALSGLATAGFSRFPVWVTETGLSTTGASGVTPSQQASALVRLVRRIAAVRQVKAVVVHTLLPPPQTGEPQESGFSVIDRRLIPKPAFCALATVWGHPHACG